MEVNVAAPVPPFATPRVPVISAVKLIVEVLSTPKLLALRKPPGKPEMVRLVVVAFVVNRFVEEARVRAKRFVVVALVVNKFVEDERVKTKRFVVVALVPKIFVEETRLVIVVVPVMVKS